MYRIHQSVFAGSFVYQLVFLFHYFDEKVGHHKYQFLYSGLSLHLAYILCVH